MGAQPVNLSLDYGTLLTTTMFNYRSTLVDNIFNAIPLFECDMTYFTAPGCPFCEILRT